MLVYKAPTKDFLFILNDLLKVQELKGVEGFESLTPEFCQEVLYPAARFHEEVLFPVGIAGDRHGAHLVDGKVLTPPGYKEAWKQYCASGWLQLSMPEELGGAGLPSIMASIIGEMRITTAHSLAMYGSFCLSAARMLNSLAPEWIRTHVVPNLATGQWTATMCLTESHCGTDLKQIRTTAVPQPDGSYAIHGSKIFISGGDHDLTDNIIHLVLAKIPDADGKVGARLDEVNVFMVSKHKIDLQTGELLEKNACHVSSIEHKMGIEGSATCVLNFDGAQAWHIGSTSGGVKRNSMLPMFLMMNYARLSTALSGVGYAEISAQNALFYAKERRSGKTPIFSSGDQSIADPIINHPDIRRNIMAAQSFAEGGRATALRVAVWQAQAESDQISAEERRRLKDMVDLFTPVMKAYFTDKGFDCASDCLQVFGGHGYTKDYGIEQVVRNARIGKIYEGANGIQAIDLLRRKLPDNDWRAFDYFFQTIHTFIGQYCVSGQADQGLLGRFVAAVTLLQNTVEEIRQESQQGAGVLPHLAVAYDLLHAFGIIVVAWNWLEIHQLLQEKANAVELTPFENRKVILACFWVEYELPLVHALCQRIQQGTPSVLKLPPEALDVE
ncbi:acyl-CoA dehydrogenase C-terminal domain-containing protein [Advenella sp. WQ 585]|uniref:Acyl-CoA dehydrogenase C-terminal domain-containing protein n=1 Tax=Advenella mandrilli TaxID=2800330 RepID=A0ABS1EFY1_9BURK|nr:acyl-CoA dehydrogenase family protein [Advenella mandrilli]MBK1781766.1 acyl-CoA dehydrogenase C-terminal domain-containing protein [Advenella mandrilli]